MNALLFVCLYLIAKTAAFHIQTPAELQGEAFTWVLATFSAHLGAPGVVAPLTFPKNNLGCDALNSSEVSGKVVLLDRGACAFVQKVQNVIDAGGLAALLVNNQDGIVSPLGAGTLSIPTLGLGRLDGIRLRNFTRVYGELVVAIVQNPMRADQKQALVDLYQQTGGANWTILGTVNNPPLGWANYTETDPCQEPWQGVSCNPDGTIRQLLLQQYAMEGTIPSSLSALETIELLDLDTNSLRGPLPPFFSTFSSMTQIDLSKNLLEGPLPQDWSRNIALTAIVMNTNRFTGNIPASIFSITNLTYVDFANLRLTGTIPDTLGQLVNLQALYLTSNSFTGQFPDVNLTLLTAVDISGNSFTGSVPSVLGIANLTTLNLANNNLSGQLPESISTMTSLRYVDISHNLFEGDIPIPGPQTRYYIASHNYFTGLPAALATNCPFLSLVDFSHNNLSAPYTDILSRLPAPTDAQVQDGQCLQYIDLSYNQITAPTAQVFQCDVSRWPLLVSISFRSNLIHNNLQFIFAVNNYLRSVDVSDNPVTGSIPISFAALPSLQNIILTNTTLKNVGTLYLPSSDFITNADVSTYVPHLNLNCPQIVTRFGAVVEVDNEYHSYELCRCEPGYRRKNTTNTVNPNIHFQCVECPEGLICPGRANDTLYSFTPHFYPTPSPDDPMKLIRCPSCQPTAGTVFRCVAHHKGRLCSQCEHGYFWTGSACNRCIPLGSALLVCSILLLVAVLIGFAVYSMFLRGLLCIPPIRQPSAAAAAAGGGGGEGGGGGSDESQASNTGSIQSSDAVVSVTMKVSYDDPVANLVDIKLKSMAAISIAINYYQTVSALSQYFALPNSVITLLAASKILSSATGAGVGLACISSQLNKYENLYTAVMLEPIIVGAGIGIFYLIGRAVIIIMRRVPMVLKGWDITCLTMLLFAINFLFFPISSTAINSFRCTEDPYTRIWYNSAYPFAECGSVPKGSRAVALLIYSGGILGLFSALVIIYNRSKPGGKWHTIIGTSFGFFFLHYRKRYNFSAILVLFRRFILSLLISLIRVNSVLSFGLVSTVLVIAVAYNIFVQPFRSMRDNYLETLTILAALFAYTLAFTLSIEELDYGAIPIVVFYFCINVAVIVWCAIEFLRGQVPKLRELVALAKMRREKKAGMRMAHVTNGKRRSSIPAALDTSISSEW